MTDRSTRKRSGCGGCAAGGIVTIVLSVLTVFVVYRSANQQPNIIIPTSPRPANNAYDDFVKVSTMFTKMKHKSPASMPGEWEANATFENYAACARDAQPGLALLRSALNKEFMAPASRSFRDRHWRGHGEFRETSRTVLGAAGYYDRIAQYNQAVDLLLDGYEMAVMQQRGAGLVGMLVSNDCESIVLNGLEPLLPRLSASDLDSAAARLERIHAKQCTYADAVKEYGFSTTACWQELISDPKRLKPSWHFYDEARILLGKGPADLLTFQDRHDLTKFMLVNKSALLQENMAYFDALSKEIRTTTYSGKSTTPMPKNLIINIGLSDVGGHLRSRYESMSAVNDLLRLEVALMRYRLANKQYPSSLNLVLPKYLPSIPIDPFSGPDRLPYRYSAKNGGRDFLLYSVGPDLKDDGGAPTRFPGDGYPGDIVAGKMWRQLAANK